MVGGAPGRLIESTIILNLNTPCVLNDVSWIKPGKAIFPWWPGFFCDAPEVPSKLGLENQKYYIDFASQNGFSSLELEPPWYGPEEDCIEHPEKFDITKPVPDLRLPELIEYGKNKGVRFFVWAHWQNVDRQADSAFPLYRSWGAAGVKIDFMNRDDQEMVRWYQMILKKAAAHQLMVLFHGAYKPTGTQRTYPNLVTREGVLGGRTGCRQTAGGCHGSPYKSNEIQYTSCAASKRGRTGGEDTASRSRQLIMNGVHSLFDTDRHVSHDR